MHKQLLTGAIEIIANKAISLDPATEIKLKALSGNSLSVMIDELGFPLCFTLSQQALLVTSAESEQCSISCNLNVLSKLADASELTELIKSDQLILKGDISVAQEISAIVKSLNIDWQNQLSNYIGDVATYKLSLLGRSLKNKLSFFKSQVSQDSSEWLLHEIKAAAHSSQVAEYSQHVAGVNKQVEALEQRIRNLQQKMASQA